MASNQKKNLYAEIARLKHQIQNVDEEHRIELSTWTRKCGERGNEIGNLRKQLADLENDDRLSFWTKKCGTLGNEIGRLRKQLAEKESDLESRHQAALHSWINKCGEMAAEIGRLRKESLAMKIEYQTERERAKHEIDVLQQRLEEIKIEHHSDILKQRIESDLKKLIDRDTGTSDIPNAVVDSQDLCAQCESVQINEVEAERIVKTYYSSEGETDDVNRLNDSVGDQDLSGSITEELLPIGTDPVQSIEVMKRKPKFVFWTTLKRHVAMKSKQVKSNTLTYNVSGTDV